MSRPSLYSTVFAAAVCLFFLSQSLILAPNINTRLFSSIPPHWLPIIGWIFFLVSLVLLAALILSKSTLIRRVFTGISAFLFVLLGLLYFTHNAPVNAILVWALAAGLAIISTGILRNLQLPFQDWLPVMISIANSLVGFGLIWFALTPHIGYQNGLSPVNAILLALAFLLPVIAGIITKNTPSFFNKKLPRLLSIPWIIWTIIHAIYLRDLAINIPPASVSFVLLVNDIIPWESLQVKPQDRFPRMFYLGLMAANVILLAVFSTFLNRLWGVGGISINLTFAVTNIFVIIFNIFFVFSFMLSGSLNIAFNQISDDLTSVVTEEPSHVSQSPWQTAVKRIVSPVTAFKEALLASIQTKDHEIHQRDVDLRNDQRRIIQLSLLNELEQKLKPVLDPPVVAQLTVNEIQRFINPALATIFTYDYPRHEFIALASAGKQSGSTPPEYRQSLSKGLIGRAARLRKTQYSPDTLLDKDFFSLENQQFRSEAAIPLLHQGLIKGVLVVDENQVNAFSLLDIETFETVGNLILSSWNRSNYDERLRELIHAGITLTTTLETDVAIREIATIVQQTLAARFVYVALIDQQRAFSRSASSGYAPRLQNYLSHDLEENPVTQTIVNATRVHRLHDVRKLDGGISLDNVNLRGFLGFPIRMRGQRIGAIMAFGKQGGAYFTEQDESLATQISNQAAASIETTWLYQQLSTAFNTTTRLYDLSNAILKTERLSDAAAAVADAAFNLGNTKEAGIVLFNPQKEIEAQVRIDADGLHPEGQHPFHLISQALISNETTVDYVEQIATVCLPLVTPRRQYGVLWLRIPDVLWQNQRFSGDIQTLTNQAALALERGILLVETRLQREEIRSAFRELETTYDQTLIALSAAVDARDRETEGHSVRVSKLTFHLGKKLGLPEDQLKSLERGGLLHDIGKIGISDTILLKPGPLTDDEWEVMRQHPDIGAKMIEGISFLQDAIPVIRYHQERWDGSGYPLGMKGEEIPLQARVFAVADVFDALTSTRPYRQRVTINEAVKHIRNHAGVEFDPKVVAALEELAIEGELVQYLTP